MEISQITLHIWPVWKAYIDTKQRRTREGGRPLHRLDVSTTRLRRGLDTIPQVSKYRNLHFLKND